MLPERMRDAMYALERRRDATYALGRRKDATHTRSRRRKDAIHALEEEEEEGRRVRSLEKRRYCVRSRERGETPHMLSRRGDAAHTLDIFLTPADHHLLSPSKSIFDHPCRPDALIVHTPSQRWRSQVLVPYYLPSDRMGVMERYDPGIWPKALVMLQQLIRPQWIAVGERLGERGHVVWRRVLPTVLSRSMPERKV